MNGKREMEKRRPFSTASTNPHWHLLFVLINLTDLKGVQRDCGARVVAGVTWKGSEEGDARIRGDCKQRN